MKIETFVKLFNTKRTSDEKEKAIQDIMKDVHIKFEDKVNRSRLIAKESYYTKENTSDGAVQEIFQQNSVAKYMFYSLTIVDLYTKIEIDYKKALEQFELLNGEILDLIINHIDQREKNEFKMLLEFACDDILVNEYETHAFIRNQVDRFATIFGDIIAKSVENLDMNSIQEIINQMSGRDN